MSVAEVLELGELATARVLAGTSGLQRLVERLNMMEVPDVLPWVRPAALFSHDSARPFCDGTYLPTFYRPITGQRYSSHEL